MGMLLDELRNGIRVRHYSRRTEEAYVGWVKRFILFNKKRHPRETGMSEVQTFLTHLAVERHVSASTQTQALSAILFLYRDVLKVNDFNFEMAVHARRPERLPVVLTREEVGVILGEMSGTPRIVAGLLYGAGLRLLECLTLRVKDLEFARNEIVVRDGKGQKDRVTMLPDVRTVRKDTRPGVTPLSVCAFSRDRRQFRDGFAELAAFFQGLGVRLLLGVRVGQRVPVPRQSAGNDLCDLRSSVIMAARAVLQQKAAGLIGLQLPLTPEGNGRYRADSYDRGT